MPSANLNSDPRIVDVLATFVTNPRTFQCPSDSGSPYSDNGTSYYATEGSSYEYQSGLGGRKIDDTVFTRRFGDSATTVMNDYQPFHGPAGALGSMNFLFASGAVGDMQ